MARDAISGGAQRTAESCLAPPRAQVRRSPGEPPVGVLGLGEATRERLAPAARAARSRAAESAAGDAARIALRERAPSPPRGAPAGTARAAKPASAASRPE